MSTIITQMPIQLEFYIHFLHIEGSHFQSITCKNQLAEILHASLLHSFPFAILKSTYINNRYFKYVA